MASFKKNASLFVLSCSLMVSMPLSLKAAAADDFVSTPDCLVADDVFSRTMGIKFSKILEDFIDRRPSIDKNNPQVLRLKSWVDMQIESEWSSIALDMVCMQFCCIIANGFSEQDAVCKVKECFISSSFNFARLQRLYKKEEQKILISKHDWNAFVRQFKLQNFSDDDTADLIAYCAQDFSKMFSTYLN